MVIAEYLKDVYGYQMFLCGGPGNRDETEDFARNFDGGFVDLVGATRLVKNILLDIVNMLEKGAA